MLGLLVPIGAGKSSLLRTLVTFQQADFGPAMLGDLDVLKDKAEVEKIRQNLLSEGKTGKYLNYLLKK
ncbi:P-loop NTPase family protein [Lutibacter citreus]|uniref:hypothetical protein n=1 Tax=Lutibacter citreus TaxID=2138210 RepID=UPI0015CFE048|nr:hypothetical protein [Lutibacter citreus]